MPQIVSGIWGKVRTDDIIDRAVTRAKLEYPTEDVSFAYLAVINKIKVDSEAIGKDGGVVAADSFTDKAVQYIAVATLSKAIGRFVDGDNTYIQEHYTNESTADHKIYIRSGGTSTTLATESVDLANATAYLYKFVISGSTLSGYRDDMSTAKITATDTTISSGYFGYRWNGNQIAGPLELTVKLVAPSSPLPKPLAVVEVPITGKGIDEDPIRPQLPQDLRDPKELGLNLNKPQINLKSVTWGAIDYKGGNTMIIAIYKHGAPYLDPKRFEDVLAIAKNKWKVPSNVQEAEEIWKELKKANPDMIAGKHTIAYHLLGDENIEPCSVADFYHGNMIEDNKIKGVPEWELRRTLLKWKDRLEKARINAELKEKHMKKLEVCLKR